MFFSNCILWSSISDKVHTTYLPSGLAQRRLQRRMCLDPCQKQKAQDMNHGSTVGVVGINPPGPLVSWRSSD